MEVPSRVCRWQRAFSIPELCVGVVILGLIAGCLVSIHVNASRNAQKSTAVNDGMQSVMLALDAIGDDVAGMIFQRGDDLRLGDDLRSVTMLVTKPLGDDLFKVQTERVSYAIEPIGPSGPPYRLARTDSRGRSIVGSVLLADMRVLLVLSGPPFKRQARLEICVVGWQSETRRPGFAATQTRAFTIAGRPPFGGKHHGQKGA